MRDLKLLVTLRKYSSVGQYYDPLMWQTRHKDCTAEIFQSDCWLGQRKGTWLSEHRAWVMEGSIIRHALMYQQEVQTFCISQK